MSSEYGTRSNTELKDTARAHMKKAETAVPCTAVMDVNVENSFTVLVISSPELTVGTYTLWCGDVQMQGCTGEGMIGGFGRPDGMTPPEGMERPEGEPPFGMGEGFEKPEKPEGEPPEGMEPPEGEMPPEGMGGGMGRPDGMGQQAGEASTEFVITDGGNEFSRVCEADSITEV